MSHSSEQAFKERKARKKNVRLFPCIRDVSEHVSPRWFLILVQDDVLMFRFVPHDESKVRKTMRPYRAFETTKKKKVEQKSQRNYGKNVKLSINKELSKIS